MPKMRPVKINGMQELEALRKRVLSALAQGRIGAHDADFIVARCSEISSRIVSMRETDENGEEVG